VTVLTAVTIAPAPVATTEPKGEAKGEEDLTKKPEGRLVVLGTSTFASNQGLGFQGNRDLFLNIVAWLAGQEGEIAIRPDTARTRSSPAPRPDGPVALHRRAAGRRDGVRDLAGGPPPPHQVAGPAMSWKTLAVLAVLAAGLGGFLVVDSYWLTPAREKTAGAKGRLWTIEPKDVEATISGPTRSSSSSGRGWEMLEPVRLGRTAAPSTSCHRTGDSEWTRDRPQPDKPEFRSA
jgi:hypothetical protein